MQLKQISFKIVILLISGIMVSSCDRTRTMRGYDFMPDMQYSQAYETYSDNPNFKDSMTMRVPVSGTVPTGIIPFRYTIDSASRARAGMELKNPFLPTDEVIARGDSVFTIYCNICHGPQGKGNGHLYTSGLYPLQPRDISAEPTAKLKDGEIYHTITLGFGSMGVYGAQIRPDDRWKVVLYVRELQKEARLSASR